MTLTYNKVITVAAGATNASGVG